MGKTNSKLSNTDAATFLKTTRFDKKELQEWHKGFMKSCPNGSLSKEKFAEMLQEFFPLGHSSEFANRAFDMLDTDKNGAINFAEFIHAISVTARGSETEKLEMAFRLYDRDGDGMISGEEMRRVAAEVHNMAGPTAGKVDEKAARRINRLLAGMDKEQRGKIDKNAFVETMLREPEVRDALDMLAKVV